VFTSVFLTLVGVSHVVDVFHFGRRTSSGVSRRSVASVRWLLRWASAGRAG
jgi:hypothetical protein